MIATVRPQLVFIYVPVPRTIEQFMERQTGSIPVSLLTGNHTIQVEND
jgi:hypothetical protein